MKLQHHDNTWPTLKLRLVKAISAFGLAALIASCSVPAVHAAVSWDSQELTENNNPAGSGTQWWFDHFNWSGVGNTPGSEDPGYLPPASNNAGGGPTDTEISTGTGALPGGEGVVYDPTNDLNFLNAGSFQYPATYGPQIINQLYISRNTTSSNKLTIKGDLQTGNIQVGKSSGTVGVATSGTIVQTGGLVKVVNQALDIAQTDTSNDGFGDGTYDYRGGSLQVSLTGGNGLRLTPGTTSESPNSIAGGGGKARFIMHNPATPGHVRASTFVFGSYAGTANSSTDIGDPDGINRGVSTVEFHYENGGTRPIQVTGNVSLNNGFLPANGSTRSSRLDLHLGAAPCAGSGCIPVNLGLFDIGGTLTGSGDLDGDGTTNNDRVLSSNDASKDYYPRSEWTRPFLADREEEDFLVEAVFGSTLYRWEVSYTGLITWSGSLDDSVVQSVSGTGGTDIVLLGHSSLSLALAGDHNGDGVVDAADYVAWRKTPLAFGGDPGYNIWRQHFGESDGGSGGSGQVPEPASLILVLVGGAAVACRRQRCLMH